ncbi:DNA-binding transcriptional regulator, AcrR family [Micromonospora viridifaciens]|uniref:DNA-binding transcriptional regulator, AcrR family n=1 Tax=Micromonospora viridifaciens TaxID=1881 RepID=A0A1C4WAH5_MICVI|nr:TetR/AcrR family transcriptional regulator [Micromonospora viridifaciens]SCE93215.1 DNA-binding transcriptional regulator, AcrR family [Micromonospora viridifaciens]
MPEEPKPRRSPAGGERQRDADRSRQRILDAALVEFGEHGYSGARISAIARRAGVNQQLISYYFNGKEGLYRALTDRWRTLSGDLNRPDAPLDEVVAAFVHVGQTQRHWGRLLIWQALSGDREEGDEQYHRSMVDDLRRRQNAGEIAPDLDPGYLQLALFGAAIAPTLLARFAEDFTGLPVDSPEFVERYREQLKRLVAHLAKAL